MPSVVQSDILVVGCGPAGLATALGLAQSHLKVTLIDKDRFPRDKVCGGGLSSRSLRVLSDLFQGDHSGLSMLPVHGFEVTTPDHHLYRYRPRVSEGELVMGATINRNQFDEELLRRAEQLTNTEVFYSTKVLGIETEHDQVRVKSDDKEFVGKVVVVADGAHSKLIDTLAGKPFDRKRDAIALRGIFKNIRVVDNSNLVGFYFLKEVFPGYFWIFPLPDGLWNAGIYVPLSMRKHKKHNLNRLFFDLIQENSELSARFQDAVLIGQIESDVLPLAKPHRVYSGNRWLSVGDSASLVDPLAGEGIGNALMSGLLAANHLVKAFEHGNFSAQYNQQFDQRLMSVLKKEFSLRGGLIRFFGNKPRLFSFLFREIARSHPFQSLVAKILYKKTVEGRLQFVKW